MLFPCRKAFAESRLSYFIILALEKSYQFLNFVRKDPKKTSAIRDLINFIYDDIHKSFSEHVEHWKSQPNSQDDSMTNQAIIEQNSNPFSNGIKSASVWVKGFFSESTVKALEEKTKTDTQIFIEDLAKHAQLWSEKTNTSKDTVFSSSSCVTPKNGSCQ